MCTYAFFFCFGELQIFWKWNALFGIWRWSKHRLATQTLQKHYANQFRVTIFVVFRSNISQANKVRGIDAMHSRTQPRKVLLLLWETKTSDEREAKHNFRAAHMHADWINSVLLKTTIPPIFTSRRISLCFASVFLRRVASLSRCECMRSAWKTSVLRARSRTHSQAAELGSSAVVSTVFVRWRSLFWLRRQIQRPWSPVRFGSLNDLVRHICCVWASLYAGEPFTSVWRQRSGGARVLYATRSLDAATKLDGHQLAFPPKTRRRCNCHD